MCYIREQFGQDHAFIGGRQLPSNILWHFAELLSCTSPGHGPSLTVSCYLEGHLIFGGKVLFTFKLACKWFWTSPWHSFSIAIHFCHFMGLPLAGLTVENRQNWENWNFLNFRPTSDASRCPDRGVSTISLQTMHHSVRWSLLHPLVVILLTLDETFYALPRRRKGVSMTKKRPKNGSDQHMDLVLLCSFHGNCYQGNMSDIGVTCHAPWLIPAVCHLIQINNTYWP